MRLFTDTSLWMHVFELIREGKLDCRPHLRRFSIATTPAVKLELERSGYGNFWQEDLCEIIDSNTEDAYTSGDDEGGLAGVDPVDETVILAARADSGMVLTDDAEVLLACRSFKIPVIRFPHFCLRLAVDGDIQKGEFSYLGLHWERKKRYSKKEISSWQKAWDKMQNQQPGALQE
jgi:hypothetical protein